MLELRRLIPLVPLMAAGALVVILGRGAPWRHEWGRTLDTAGGTTIFLGPIVAAASALLVADHRRQRDIVDSSPRGWISGVRSAAAATAAGVSVLLAAAVSMLLIDAATDAGGPTSSWPLVTAAVSLIWYAAAGVFAATKMPLLLTVLLIGPATFFVGAVCAEGLIPNFLRFGPSGDSLVGLTWDPMYAAAQTTALLGMVAALLASTMRAASHSWRVRAIVAVGLVVALISMTMLGLHGDRRFKLSPEKADQCAGSLPIVCVAPSNKVVLRQVSEQADRLAQGLTDARVLVPTRFSQELPASVPGSEPLFSMPVNVNVEGFSAVAAAQMLSRPAACPAFYADTPPAEPVFEALAYLQAYLLTTAGDQVQSDDRSMAAWLQAPLEQRQAWVRTTYAALTSCDLSQVRPPS